MSPQLKSKNVTVFDVAKAAGVSKSTVSLVLTQSDKVNANTRDKVLQAIELTGYVYNRDAASLRGKRSNLVAIVINDLTNPYSAQLALGLEANIRKMGLFSMLVNSGENVATQEQLVRSLQEYNLAAFVICPAPNTPADWCNRLAKQGTPVVHIMRTIAGADVPTILPDNQQGTRLATEYLLAQGFTNIAFLGGNDSISDYGERLSGFVQTMQVAGIAYRPQLHIQSSTNRHGGRLALAKALELAPDLQAVVCFSDVVAYGAIEQMRAQGKKPGKDIAIIGFDDLEDSRLMSPSLSSVHIDADSIGAAVCDVLHQLKGAQSPAMCQRIPVSLRIRESSQSRVE